jgi:AraC-like DNA-binding protein
MSKKTPPESERMRQPDRLESLLARFELSARVFHTGALCGWADFDAADGVGHLHLLREGQMVLERPGHAPLELEQPTLIFHPRACAHRLVAANPDEPPDMLCASIEFGAAYGNPVLREMPDTMIVPLHESPGLEPAVTLLFSEAFERRCGRQASLDRLTEYLVIQLLRHAMAKRILDAGALAGLADARLSRALTAMHDQPGQRWTLEVLARQAGMSRARFAVHFKRTVGHTPMDYLTDWRISLARTMLRRGEPVKRVADQMGYASTATFARVFAQRMGVTPAKWISAR